MKKKLLGYADLLRIHFGWAWPLLFVAGLRLSRARYGPPAAGLYLRAALIGFFAFEAGFILNDYIDQKTDRRDVEGTLSSYWRLSGRRPIPSGVVSPAEALILFWFFVAVALALVLTLPAGRAGPVILVVCYCLAVETLYQLLKRRQSLPLAQVLGRTDFALFPVAGYLMHGGPDRTCLLLFLFFYPLCLAHLAVNDLVDAENDRARGLLSLPVMYGRKATKIWIYSFTLLHFLTLALFGAGAGPALRYGLLAGGVCLIAANAVVAAGREGRVYLRALFLFHCAYAVYALTILAA